MKHLLTALALILLGVTPAAAQVQSFEARRSTERTAQAEARDGGPQVLHVTDRLARTPEARQALDEYQRLAAQGLLPHADKRTEDELGDVRPFRVINISNNRYETYDFQLLSKSDRFQVWVEVTELDEGDVTQSDVDAVAEALGEITPPGSFNPDAGIIENDEVIFGAPPDVDGDGLTDVLLVDVRDNYEATQTFVAGFVTPADLSGPLGNQRDVLYLDIDPSLIDGRFGLDFTASTAAHEYQHLIHFRYDRGEESFVNEALSEWAEHANGYPGRQITYLNDDDDYNRSFLRFQDSGQLVDRQRGFRFVNYFADMFGVLEAGSITRQGTSGLAGIQDALNALGAGLSFGDLLFNFHVANFLNDAGVDPRYGFTTPFHANIRANPTASFDGRFATETPMDTGLLQAGGVAYYVWDNVTDLNLTLNAGNGAENVRLVALLFQSGGVSVRALDFGSTTFTGDFDRVAVVAAHIDPDASSDPNGTCSPSPDPVLAICGRFDYAATWTTEEVFAREDVTYDTGVVTAENNTLEAFQLCTASGRNATPELCESSRQANLFEKPAGGIFTSVAVGPYFDHDFSSGTAPDDAPRDFRLVIWDTNGPAIRDGIGRPGDELFSLEVTDTRSNSGSGTPTGNAVNFLEIDLSDFQDQLAGLPEAFYVGLTNTGDDVNFLVMGVTPFAGSMQGNTSAEDAISFLYRSDFNNGQGVWAAFHELRVGEDPVLQERVLPIRASFLVPLGPVANEKVDELPEAVALFQNYPNPFNPATTIRYALPHTAAVRLAVYDLLGRRVATLVDAVEPAGEHAVALEATGWTSGLYFYTIEAAGQRQTRRMVLLK